MSVHAGAERNVCNTVVSTDTHQTTTNFDETMCKTDINYVVNSEDPQISWLLQKPPDQDLHDFHTTYEFVVINQNIIELF